MIGQVLSSLQKALGRKFELGLLGLVIPPILSHPGPVVWAGIALAALFIVVEGVRDILVAYMKAKTEYIRVKGQYCPLWQEMGKEPPDEEDKAPG